MEVILINVFLLLLTSSCSASPLLDTINNITTSITFTHQIKHLFNTTIQKIFRNDGVYELCDGIHGKRLIGCCNSVKYMESVMVKNGTFIKYGEEEMYHKDNVPKSIILPNILQQKQTKFWYVNISVINRYGKLPYSQCKSFFNGTLHVSGRKAMHKLFHALNDNILPLMTQILLDALLFPEYAKLPRMSLTFPYIPVVNLTQLVKLRGRRRYRTLAPTPSNRKLTNDIHYKTKNEKSVRAKEFSEVVDGRRRDETIRPWGAEDQGRIYRSTRVAKEQPISNSNENETEHWHDLLDEIWDVKIKPLDAKKKQDVVADYLEQFASKYLYHKNKHRLRPYNFSEGRHNSDSSTRGRLYNYTRLRVYEKARRRSRAIIFPHAVIYRDLLEGGERSLQEIEGMCFRRVVWGTGMRMHYVDAMVVLRRLTADFARAFVLRAYKPPLPQSYLTQRKVRPKFSLWDLISKGGTLRNRTNELYRNGHPLKIVYMSRGSTGKGRSLGNEKLLVNELEASGALVHVCCSAHENINFSKQLSSVIHADVIIGLHGAGLVNAIFAPRGCMLVELKTVYGYTTDLFLRTADSRTSIHAHIDIRDYSSIKKTQVHVFDEELVNRVIDVIKAGMAWHKQGNNIGQMKRISDTHEDYLIGPSSTSDALSSVLGPPLDVLSQTCLHNMVYSVYRADVIGAPRLEHCHECPQNLSKFF